MGEWKFDWLHLVPTAGSLLLVAAFVWREALGRWLSQWILHKFAKDLEQIKGDLKSAELRLEAELQAKQSQIDTLTTVATSGRSARLPLVEKRRLEAVERIWRRAIELSSNSTGLRALEAMKIDAVLNQREGSSENVKKVFSIFDQTFGATAFLNEKKGAETLLEQPFVSAEVWAYYSAYNSLITNALLLVSSISRGLYEEDLFNFNSIKNVIKSALPHHAENIDQHDIAYCYMLSQELQDRLLKALRTEIDGTHRDDEDVKKAAAILEAANKLGEESNKNLAIFNEKSDRTRIAPRQT